MTGLRHRRDITGQVLRSITPVTGALAAGLGVCLAIVGAVFYEMKFGRPSSTSGIAIPFSVILGGLAAAVGAAVGRGVQQMVSRSRWAGPSDLRVSVALVSIAIIIPMLLGIGAVRRLEAENAPRVIHSTGEISRVEGTPALSPVRSAVFLWTGLPHPDHPRGELRWNGRQLDVRVVDGQLLLRADDRAMAAVDISRFDYAREVYGVTATLSGDGREWLALLVKLRVSARRELLLVFDPGGALVHEELLEASRGFGPAVGLDTAGPADGRQEIVLDRGAPRRYAVQPRGVR